MKKSITALALALALAGTLTACSNRDPNPGGSNNGGSGSPGTTSGSTSGTPGTVSRRYGGGPIYNSRGYLDDGRYAAGSNGQVYGNDGGSVSRDLTRDARDRKSTRLNSSHS